MCKVQTPGREMGPESGFGQFPVVPGITLIREELDGIQAASGPCDQRRERKAEQDAT